MRRKTREDYQRSETRQALSDLKWVDRDWRTPVDQGNPIHWLAHWFGRRVEKRSQLEASRTEGRSPDLPPPKTTNPGYLLLIVFALLVLGLFFYFLARLN